MNLVGKTQEQITHATRHLDRRELLDLLYRHVTLEPMFTKDEIAAARRITPRKAAELMKNGTIRSHEPVTNRLRAPLSAIREWDEDTALTLNGNGSKSQS